VAAASAAREQKGERPFEAIVSQPHRRETNPCARTVEPCGVKIPNSTGEHFFVADHGAVTLDGGVAAVPEPGQVAASLLLLGGIGGYVFLKRRKVAKSAVLVAAA
jgi:hypothetical protein